VGGDNDSRQAEKTHESSEAQQITQHRQGQQYVKQTTSKSVEENFDVFSHVYPHMHGLCCCCLVDPLTPFARCPSSFVFLVSSVCVNMQAKN